MIETAIFIVGLMVGGFCVRAYFEHYMTVDRKDAADIQRAKETEARALNKKISEQNTTIGKLDEEVNDLSKHNHTLADKIRTLDNELSETKLTLDSEVANYQAMLDQVEEDQALMEANHKAEIESLQAHIVPPKDYPDDVVEKAEMFDTMSDYHKKMARRKFDAVTDRRKHHAE